MNIATKYAFTFILNAATVAFISSILFGWDSFIQKMGGVKSLAGLIALILVFGVIIAAASYLMIRDYTDEEGKLEGFLFGRDLTITVLAVLVFCGIGLTWLSLPGGSGFKVLVGLLIIAAVSGLELWVITLEKKTRATT